MERLPEIIRYLTAAGGTPSRDGERIYLTYEEKGSLCMRIWTRPELKDKVWIADNIRPDTAALVVNRNQLKVFAVDSNNSIKCFTGFPPVDRAAKSETKAEIDGEVDGEVDEDMIDDDALWDEDKITDVNTRVHPQSQLTVSYDKNTVFVFYQKPDGTLGCINEYANKWKDVKLPAVTALSGTPLATCNTNYAVFLFYISTDGTVHYLENREGKWNDVLFSTARIVDPKANISTSAFKLTVAEDRQPFERIRPLVFCLGNNDLSMIKFRSKRLKTIGRLKDTELIPCLDAMGRNRYYFWSPYPFYTMIKRRGNNQARATISHGLWDRRPSSQQDHGDSSVTRDFNRPKEPFIDNRPTSTTKNKTLATVRLETTNAQAIISPKASAQQEITSNIPAQSSTFVGFGNFAHPLLRMLRGYGLNGDAAGEGTPRNGQSNHTDTTDVPPGTDESQTNRMENHAAEPNEVKASRSEVEEVGPEEAIFERLQNNESSINGTEAEEVLIKDQSENPPEEADSECTEEEEADSDGTRSEAADTAPSEVEVEVEVEENLSRAVQAEEAQAEEAQIEEVVKDEFEDEEDECEASEGEEVEEVEGEDIENDEARRDQTEKIQIEESHNKEVQTEPPNQEVRNEEVQLDEIQPGEGQTRNIQAGEAQIKTSHTDAAPTNGAKPEENEAIVPSSGGLEAEKREPKNVTWREPEAESASHKAKVPTTQSSTAESTETSPATKTSITKENGQEADVVESDLEHLEPKASTHVESPNVGKGKGLATTEAPILNKPRYNTPQDIKEDMAKYIKDADLDQFYSPDSSYVSTLANNAFEIKNKDTNYIQGITTLNLYQPVLYCDDSTSMKSGTRVKDQKEMVKRITRISTSIVPKGYGTSLQFINHIRDVHDDRLTQKQVEAIMKSVKPTGHTQIGTNLKKKILQPLIYDVINSNRKIERPILVSCITDGCPSHEPFEMFKETILECTQILNDNGYPPSTIRFQVSQIGNSKSADQYLKQLRDDPELRKVVYCTAQRLDEQFKELRHNEDLLERWLLRTLLEPIIIRHTDNLNL